MKKRLILSLLLCSSLAVFGQWYQTNCLLGQVRNFLASGSEFFVTTSKGLYVSPDSGKTWRTLKADIDVEKIVVHGGTIITARNQTLLRSKDYGLSWEDISANFHPHSSNNIIRTIFFHDQRLFIGLGYSDAMYHSDDYGDSWIEAPYGFPYFTWGYHTIDDSEQNDSNMYVGTSGGVYRALNWDGDSWQEYSNGIPRTHEVYPDQVRCLLSFNGKLFAGTFDWKGIFVSADQAVWWTYSGLDEKLIYDLCANDSRIFAVCNSSGLLTSDDEGQTWTSKGMTNDQPYLISTLGSKTFANTYTSGFLISEDQGASWIPPNTLTNGYVTAVYCHNGKLLAGTSNKEIFISSNQGTTWDKSTIMLNWGITNGNWINWFYSSHDTIYAATGCSGVLRSDDGGATWNFEGNGLPYATSAYQPVRILAAGIDTIYAGTENGLYKTGISFTYWRKTGFTGKVFSLVINDSVLYAGSDSGVYSSSDNGRTWNLQGLSQDSVLCLTFSQNQLMAGTNKGIFRQDRASGQWIQVGGGTLSGHIRNMIPYYSNLFVTAGDGSVLITRNNGMTWTDVSQDVFDTVTNLTIVGSFIFASTFGEGVWMRNLNEIAGEEKYVQPDFITLQPNPVRDKLWIRIDPTESGEVVIKIMSAIGKICLSEKTSMNKLENNIIELNCANLSPGLYLVQVKLGNKIITKKIILQ